MHPANVRSRVLTAINGLKAVGKELAEVKRTGGAVELANRVRDRQPQIEKLNSTLNEFRRLAGAKGIDAEALIDELGGAPDFTQYGAPSIGPMTAQEADAILAPRPGDTFYATAD